MRARILACSALLLLAACDAGHREDGRADPGGDNAAPGPQLAIVAPGPDQVVGTDAPKLLFELRNPKLAAQRAGDRIHYLLDHGAVRVLEEPLRPVALGTLAAGSHVLRAFVVDGEGDPYGNPEAFATRQFHVGARDRAFDVESDDGERTAFRDDAPWLLVLPADGTTVHFLVANAALGEDGFRVLATESWRRHALYQGGRVDLRTCKEFAEFESGTVTLELQQRRPDDGEGPVWAPVPGPFSRVSIPLKP
jgi:hypothetical protein